MAMQKEIFANYCYFICSMHIMIDIDLVPRRITPRDQVVEHQMPPNIGIPTKLGLMYSPSQGMTTMHIPGHSSGQAEESMRTKN
jgi:hypothetical protein